jgi:hypothetical protein
MVLIAVRRKLGVLVALAVVAAGLTLVSATPASALGPGTFCMFNAPNDAFGLGHNAWAFREGPNNHWFFGATEFSDGSPNSTWQKDGTQKDMFDTFTGTLNLNGIPYFTAGDYTGWRCHATSSSAVGGALNQAHIEQNNGYDVVTNNSLTKAVAILSTYYGGDHLDNGIGIPPNCYFVNSLAAANWGPIHPLGKNIPLGSC